VEFRNNYIGSLLQIAKLENLNTLKAILIEPEDNPVVHCSFLKEFVVYRFPNIVQVNKEDIKEGDRQRAKQLFHHFDRVLQIPEKFYNPENLKVYPSEDPETKKDRTYLKTFNKVLNEAAESIIGEVAGKVTAQVTLRSDLDKVFEQAVLQLIAKVEH